MGIFVAMLCVGSVLFLYDPCRNPLSYFQASGSIDLVEVRKLDAASRHLKSVSSRAEADKMVAQAMHQARQLNRLV